MRKQLLLGKRFYLILFFIFVVFVITPYNVFSQPYPEDLKEMLTDAFEAVEEAEKNGGDISLQVDELNRIISLLESGSEYRVTEVRSELGEVKEAALTSGELGYIDSTSTQQRSGVILVVTVVVAFLVWKYMPKLVWQLWMRSRGEWRVYPR